MSDWVFRFGTQCVPKFTRFFQFKTQCVLNFQTKKNSVWCNSNWSMAMNNKQLKVQLVRLEMAGYLKELGYAA